MHAVAAAGPGQGSAILATVESFAVLLGVAALVALAARRVNVPYRWGIVLFTLLVQGTTVGVVVRRTGVHHAATTATPPVRSTGGEM